MAKFFEGFEPDAYRKKNEGKPVEDFLSDVNKRKGTTTEDPAKLGKNKNLTKAERARQAEYYEQ